MFRELKYEGDWFLPEKPSQRFKGTLTFSHTAGAHLDLKGSFRVLTPGPVETDQYEIILGVSEDGKKITLVDCFETGYSFSSSTGTSGSSKYYANRVLVGAHFTEEKAIKFKKMFAHYPNLDEWVGVTGIKLPELKTLDRLHLTIKCDLPEDVHVAKIHNYDLSFVFRVEGLTYTIVQTDVTLKQRCFLRIDAIEALPYQELLSVVYSFQNLLSLAIMTPVAPTEISGIMEQINEKPVVVSIYFEPTYEGNDAKLVLPPRMLWHLSDVRDKMQDFFATWFQVADQLQPVYDIYFANLYRPAPYTDFRFLNYIQALEAYHRRRMEDRVQLQSRFQERKNRILGMPLTAEDKKWLTWKLKYAYEPSLKERMSELVSKFVLPFSRYIKEKDAFVDLVADTRNYLIHYDDELKDQAASGVAIYDLSERLKILIEICLLHELGFSQQMIKERLEQYHLYGQLEAI